MTRAGPPLPPLPPPLRCGGYTEAEVMDYVLRILEGLRARAWSLTWGRRRWLAIPEPSPDWYRRKPVDTVPRRRWTDRDQSPE